MGELNHMACPCASSPPLSLSRQSSVSPKSRKQRALSRGTHTVGQLIQKAVCSFSLGCVRKNAQHPHFDVPENLQYTSDYASNVFFIKVQMLNGRIMFVGYNWYQTPHSLTMPLLFILLTQKLQVDVIPPKLKHYFLMSWTSLFRNTKEYSLLISFKNGLYGKNASFKDGMVHSDNPISIIFWITTTLRIVCQLTWGMKLSLFVSTPASWQFFKGPKKGMCFTILLPMKKNYLLQPNLFFWTRFVSSSICTQKNFRVKKSRKSVWVKL